MKSWQKITKKPENVAFRTEISVLKEEMAVMQNQLDWFKRQMFGRKTEQTSVILEGGEQLSMFPKNENEKPQCSSKNEETITIPEHKRKKKRTFEDAMGELPAEEIVYELEEKVCDKCGAEMVEIGVEKRDELVYTPAKFHVRRHIVKVYKCTKCGNDPERDAELDDVEPCHFSAISGKPPVRKQ